MEYHFSILTCTFSQWPWPPTHHQTSPPLFVKHQPVLHILLLKAVYPSKRIQSNLNIIPLVPSFKSKAIVIWVNSSLPKVPDGVVHLLHWVLLPIPVIDVSQLKEGEDARLADNTQEPPKSRGHVKIISTNVAPHAWFHPHRWSCEGSSGASASSPGYCRGCGLSWHSPSSFSIIFFWL